MSAMLATLSPEARERLRAYHERRLAEKEAKLALAEQALEVGDDANRWKRIANVTKLRTAIVDLRSMLANG